MITFANIDYYPAMYTYCIASVYIILVYQFLKTQRFLLQPVSYTEFWLLAIAESFFFLGYRNFVNYSVLTIFVLDFLNPLLIFIAGAIITNCIYAGQTQRMKNVIHAVAIGCGIHVVFNIGANIGHDRWNTVDAFNQNGTMAATNLGSLNTFIFALLPYIIVTKNKKVKIIGFVLFGLSVVYAFILGTRTQLYLLVAISVFSLILYFVRHYRGKITVRTFVLFLSILLFFSVAAILVLRNNIFGIRDKIMVSNLVIRYFDSKTQVSDSLRVQLVSDGIKGLFSYPLGNNHYSRYSHTYFHNYWLDVGRVGGIIPTLCLLILDARLFVHGMKLFKRDSFEEDLKFAILGLYIGFYMNFLMEPIMDGYISLFYRFCLFSGLCEGLYHKATSEKGSGITFRF